MKLFLVTYSGSWMGGRAVAVAKNEDEAIELVRNDSNTSNFTDPQVTELPTDGVVYNWDGEY